MWSIPTLASSLRSERSGERRLPRRSFSEAGLLTLTSLPSELRLGKPALEKFARSELRLAGQLSKGSMGEESMNGTAKAARRSPPDEGGLSKWHYVYTLQSQSHPHQLYTGQTQTLRNRS